jgi:peroxiredoxin
MPALSVGEPAPDFDLPACTGDQKHRFRLSALRGEKNVIIAFYVLNWTPT